MRTFTYRSTFLYGVNPLVFHHPVCFTPSFLFTILLLPAFLLFLCRPSSFRLFPPYSISSFLLFHFTLSLHSLSSLPSSSQPLPLSILPSQNPSSFRPYFFHSFSFTLPLYRPSSLNPSSFSSSTFHPFLLTPFFFNIHSQSLCPLLCFWHCLYLHLHRPFSFFSFLTPILFLFVSLSHSILFY